MILDAGFEMNELITRAIKNINILMMGEKRNNEFRDNNWLMTLVMPWNSWRALLTYLIILKGSKSGHNDISMGTFCCIKTMKTMTLIEQLWHCTLTWVPVPFLSGKARSHQCRRNWKWSHYAFTSAAQISAQVGKILKYTVAKVKFFS